MEGLAYKQQILSSTALENVHKILVQASYFSLMKLFSVYKAATSKTPNPPLQKIFLFFYNLQIISFYYVPLVSFLLKWPKSDL